MKNTMFRDYVACSSLQNDTTELGLEIKGLVSIEVHALFIKTSSIPHQTSSFYTNWTAFNLTPKNQIKFISSC